MIACLHMTLAFVSLMFLKTLHYMELILLQEKPSDLKLEISSMFKESQGLPAAPLEQVAVVSVSPLGKGFPFNE